MKSIFTIICLAMVAFAVATKVHSAESYCQVTICNKLERFTLSPWKMMKDQMGETCWASTIPKADAQVGKVLDSQSRWYQGKFNPTKKSVTRITEVISCS